MFQTNKTNLFHYIIKSSVEAVRVVEPGCTVEQIDVLANEHVDAISALHFDGTDGAGLERREQVRPFALEVGKSRRRHVQRAGNRGQRCAPLLGGAVLGLGRTHRHLDVRVTN